MNCVRQRGVRMRLCEYCIENILKNTESWGYHRCYACLREGSEWTVHDVEKNERCLFCWTLRHDVETLEPELKEHSGPVYRWSIRSLSRIRESLETVIVAFRQIPKANEDGGIGEEILLPERTFYFFPEDAIAPLPSLEQLGTSTNPGENSDHQIKEWIETCNTTHTGCMKRRKAMTSSPRFVPTRLLDISGPPESPMKIVETAKTLVRGPYASLSHCWGLEKFVELVPETYKQFVEENGVPWHKLTKNFQEAIEVARFLDIEYVWIDSLCIIQGPKGDFPSEASKMHQVYRNSYCNIAVVDSADGNGGLFRERDPDDITPVRYQAEKSAMFGSKAWAAVPGDLWDRELLRTKLYVRGWVFQGIFWQSRP